MKDAARSRRAIVGSLFAALALVACGGGGGGSGDSPGAPPPPTGATPSGLVPAAPTLGAVLVSDAAELRPRVDGAVWAYHGTQRRVDDGHRLGTYATRTTQRAVGGAFEETATNLSNDGEGVDQIRLSAGRIESDVSLPIPGRPDEAFVGIELRSPVRAGDQYVSIDRRITDVADLDGDGRADAIDLAIYARVIGEETVELPTLPAVRAIRVDLTMQLRARYSRDNSLSPVTDAVQRAWYVRGLGIVRRQFEEHSDAYLSRILSEEWLVAHERPGHNLGPGRAAPTVHEGVAFLPPTRDFPWKVFNWGDQTLLIETSSVSAPQLWALGGEGQVQAQRTLTHLRAQRLVAGDQGIAVLSQTTSGADAAFQLWRLDKLGSPQGPSAGVSFSLQDRRVLTVIRSVYDRGHLYLDNELWMAYETDDYPYALGSRRQVLRAVDTSTGLFASAELDVTTHGQPASNLVASNGSLWQVRQQTASDGTTTLRLMSLPISTRGPAQSQVLTSGLSGEVFQPHLLPLDGGGIVMLWRGQMLPIETSSDPFGGVLIRPDGSLVRTSDTLPLQDERLTGIPQTHEFVGLRGQRLWFRHSQSGQMLPDIFSIPFDDFKALDVAASTALSALNPKHLRHALSVNPLQDPQPAAGWMLPLLQADRLLWFGYDTSPTAGSTPQPMAWPIFLPPGD